MYDDNGDLQTDLVVKETDSRAYLYFGLTNYPDSVFKILA